jgi:hypothetical protein
MVAFVNTSLKDAGCTGQTGVVALTRGVAGAVGVIVRVTGAGVTTGDDAGAAAGADGTFEAGVVTGLVGAEELTEVAAGVLDGGVVIDAADCVVAAGVAGFEADTADGVTESEGAAEVDAEEARGAGAVTVDVDVEAGGTDGRIVMFVAVDVGAEAVTFAATEGVVVGSAVDRAGVALVAEGEANVSDAGAEGAGPVERAEAAVGAGVETDAVGGDPGWFAIVNTAVR